MLNTAELFGKQEKLDRRIQYKGEDLKNKTLIKLTALRVEIGEMMNEWRYFKAWSKDRKSRRRKNVKCDRCDGRGMIFLNYGYGRRVCEECEGQGYTYENPLLEEYVDGLHFILSIGLDIDGVVAKEFTAYVPDIPDWGIMKHVEAMHGTISNFRSLLNVKSEWADKQYYQLLNLYLGLGKLLEFSDGEIKAMYFSKNEKNHIRQDTGY